MTPLLAPPPGLLATRHEQAVRQAEDPSCNRGLGPVIFQLALPGHEIYVIIHCD